jgi:hypothetical protein
MFSLSGDRNNAGIQAKGACSTGHNHRGVGDESNTETWPGNKLLTGCLPTVMISILDNGDSGEPYVSSGFTFLGTTTVRNIHLYSIG